MSQEPTLPGRPQYRARWWTDGLTEAWVDVRASLLRGWPLGTGPGRPLTPDHAEEAMAMGFGARRTQAFAAWDDELAALLKREWQSNGPVDCSWERAAAAIQHGWDRGGAR